MARLAHLIAAIFTSGLLVVPASAADAHGGHGGTWQHALTLELGRDDSGAFILEGDGWYGGDQSRLWVRADAAHDGDTAEGSLELYYGENVAEFWDVLAGLRVDDGDTGHVNFAAISLVGLAPQFIETELSLYLSEDGDVSLRYAPSFEIPVTQRLIAELEGEADLFFNDAPELLIGAGLSSAELALSLRYQLTPRIAPMVKFTQEWSFGETSGLRRAAGEDTSSESLMLGLYLRL